MISRNRTEPCSDCPFRPGGRAGKISPEKLARMAGFWPCHQSYGYHDDAGKFHYLEAPTYERCAGNVLFGQNIGRRPEPEDRQMIPQINDPEPTVFRSTNDLLEYYKQKPSV